jgi:uncharacterized membrane protein
MELLIKIVLIIHVSAGFLALVFGAIAFGLKKNTPKHKPVGKIYFWCMTIVFVTAIFLSIAKGRIFFFYIAVFSYYSTLIAYRSLKLKNLHKGEGPYFVDWAIEIIAGLTFLGMIGFAFQIYFTHGNMGAIVPLVFGGMGVWGVIRNIQLFLRGPKETLYWYKKHIGNMMGSYIGAITAFLVNQTDHIPINPTILWLAPTGIIVPIIIWELKKVKSKPIDA